MAEGLLSVLEFLPIQLPTVLIVVMTSSAASCRIASVPWGSAARMKAAKIESPAFSAMRAVVNLCVPSSSKT